MRMEKGEGLPGWNNAADWKWTAMSGSHSPISFLKYACLVVGLLSAGGAFGRSFLLPSRDVMRGETLHCQKNQIVLQPI